MNDIDFRKIEDEINKIEGKAKRFITIEKKTSFFKTVPPEYKIYLLCILFIFLTLYFIKPKIIMEKDLDLTSNKPKNINYIKFISLWIGMSFILITGIYAYKYRQK